MSKLILRQKAIDDLSSIWIYTAETWSEKQADKYHNMIKIACRNIANGIVIGKTYDNVNPNLLGYQIGKHIVFYQECSRGEVEVVRILHERMDIENRLKE